MSMRTEYKTLLLKRHEGHVLIVTLNRPDSSNALNTQMGLDLRDLFAGIYVDQDDLRCIVLTGSGSKAFCAGGDLKERNEMTTEAWQAQHAVFEQMTESIRNCPIPIIAAVNGAAYGGGCELALASDFVYASRSARFAQTETKLGIMPGTGGTQNLPRACGVRRAKEIILTGESFTALQAYEWGIVNQLAGDESLIDDTLATARRISANAPIAIQQAKKSINIATEVDLKSGYAFEIEAYQKMVPTEDRLEGVRAFNEKRPPRFQGR